MDYEKSCYETGELLEIECFMDEIRKPLLFLLIVWPGYHTLSSGNFMCFIRQNVTMKHSLFLIAMAHGMLLSNIAFPASDII
jgi:hypothetical protein